MQSINLQEFFNDLNQELYKIKVQKNIILTKRQMKKSSKQKVVLNSAYRQVNLIDENANRIMHSIEGPKEFQDLFRPIAVQEGVQIEKQPLYFDQVDHNIEEIGIMTVKEVKYLTDQEWQNWIKGRENAASLVQPLKTYKYQSRHNLAINRNRNEKGQFVPKPTSKPSPNTSKTKKILKKRGRKPKSQHLNTS